MTYGRYLYTTFLFNICFTFLSKIYPIFHYSYIINLSTSICLSFSHTFSLINIMKHILELSKQRLHGFLVNQWTWLLSGMPFEELTLSVTENPTAAVMSGSIVAVIFSNSMATSQKAQTATVAKWIQKFTEQESKVEKQMSADCCLSRCSRNWVFSAPNNFTVAAISESNLAHPLCQKMTKIANAETSNVNSESNYS